MNSEVCSDDRFELKSCAQCAEGMGRYADSLCDPLKQRIAEIEEQRDVLMRCLENDYGIKASWDGLRKLWLTESATTELGCIEDNSRWHELFGTPERAARTLERMDVDACNWCVNSSGNPEDCRSCPYEYDYYGCYLPDGFSLLEWLRGDA